mmetsp:Transcript_10730/g.16828  ORF Transcript_10730/g.16828 Transcript_10730/m.16828 type:complete len:249 (-) Transcript_10730:702-1448(-)
MLPARLSPSTRPLACLLLPRLDSHHPWHSSLPSSKVPTRRLLGRGTRQRAGRRCFTSIPIVDIGKLGGSVSERTVIGKELDAACRDCGFFYIRGHGVDETLLKSVRELTREWFDLPDNQKQLIQVGEHTKFRGWQPLGVNVTRYEGGFQRDWHESIDLYREVQVANSTDPRELRTINPWPKQIPLLEPALKAYVTAMLRLGRHLMRGIAIGLELSPTVFEDANKIDESYWCMRLINYPPLADAPKASG